MIEQQQGFTLAEVTISMAILSMVMLVATMAFTTIVQLQQKNAVIREVQQTTRHITEMIARDIRNSDHYTLVDLGGGDVQLTLPGSLSSNESRVQYVYRSDDGLYRERCGVQCSGNGDNIARSIRIINFGLDPIDSESDLSPLRISLYAGQLNADLDDRPQDPYFYHYETSTMAVPRR